MRDLDPVMAMESSKISKFNPVRFWKHYQAATKYVFEDEYEDVAPADIDPLDHEDEESKILDAATYVPVIKGIYPVASKQFVRIDNEDALSEFGIDFLTEQFMQEFMAEASRLHDRDVDGIDMNDFRDNPASGRKSVRSEVYILWMLEAYDATSGSGLSTIQRLELAHKATLDEMVAEGYAHQDGTLTPAGIEACKKVVVTPWAKSRFDGLIRSIQVAKSANEMARDNPKGFPLTGKYAKVKAGSRRQFMRSTDPSDLSPEGTEVVMYRPKIELDDESGGKKFYRPRIYLTVPKDITLADSDKARKLIRNKATKSVTYDPSSRRYVHTPGGPMSEADRIAFYLSPKLKSKVKEVAPVKRLQKGAGPRGKDLQAEVIGSVPIKVVPYSGITQTDTVSMVLQSLQYNYLTVRKNADNKSLTDKQLKTVATNTFNDVYESYVRSTTMGVEEILRTITRGVSGVKTIMFDISKPNANANTIAAALNLVPDIQVTVADETSSLKEFVVGKVVSTAKAASFTTVTKNIGNIMDYMQKDISSLIEELRNASDEQ
jgi:hypothetical protein